MLSEVRARAATLYFRLPSAGQPFRFPDEAEHPPQSACIFKGRQRPQKRSKSALASRVKYKFGKSVSYVTSGGRVLDAGRFSSGKTAETSIHFPSSSVIHRHLGRDERRSRIDPALFLATLCAFPGVRMTRCILLEERPIRAPGKLGFGVDGRLLQQPIRRSDVDQILI